jgi:hypothetical protein
VRALCQGTEHLFAFYQSFPGFNFFRNIIVKNDEIARLAFPDKYRCNADTVPESTFIFFIAEDFFLERFPEL